MQEDSQNEMTFLPSYIDNQQNFQTLKIDSENSSLLMPPQTDEENRQERFSELMQNPFSAGGENKLN